MIRNIFILFFVELILFASDSCYKLYDQEYDKEVLTSVYILVDKTFEADNTMRVQLYKNIEGLISKDTYFI